jgi:hypothetical protein
VLRAGQLVFFVSQTRICLALIQPERPSLRVLKAYGFPAARRGESWEATLRQWLRQCPEARLACEEVHVLYQFPRVSWVPPALVRPTRGAGEAIQQMLFGNAGTYCQLLDCEVPGFKARLFFQVPQRLHRAMHERWPEARYHHAAAAWIGALRASPQVERQHELYANMEGSTLFVFLWDQRKAKLFNAYTCPGESDVLYYLLMVMHTHQLRPQECPVWLSGTLPHEGSLHRLLRQYLPRLAFHPLAEAWRYPAQMEVLPKHAYIPLLDLSVCAS